MPDEDNPLPLRLRPGLRLGVIYCLSNLVTAGREQERVVDFEVVSVANAVKTALEEKGCQVDLVDLGSAGFGELRSYDWIFNLAETIDGFPYTEYEITEQLETMGIGFSGSSSTVLKVCLDKSLTKAALAAAGLNTPAYEVINPGDQIKTGLKFPVFVKPLHEDGSVGISNDSIVHSNAGLAAKVSQIHRMYAQGALVEEYIAGRDILASVLGNGSAAEVLPLSECTYGHYDGPPILTFAAKWMSESAPYQKIEVACPCTLDPETARLIRSMALQACAVLGCRDYVSVDFRLDGRTPYILEVNANPCINPDGAGFVRAGGEAGYSYTELVARIAAASFARL